MEKAKAESCALEVLMGFVSNMRYSMNRCSRLISEKKPSKQNLMITRYQ